jgi:hypothetical protein
VAGSCEHGNEFPGSIRGGEFVDKLSNCQLLKKNSALCSKCSFLMFINCVRNMFVSAIN